MLRQDLLKEELDEYEEIQKVILKPIKFNRNFFFNLFKQYKNCNMTENSYCCCGEETCCWQELYEEGVWFRTLQNIKDIIWRETKFLKHYLRSRKKLGDRLYVYKDKDHCYIYIYLRDVIQTDYHIWFYNELN